MTVSKLCRLLGALALLAGLAAIPDARAQSSASYRLEETSVNSGGHPGAGVVLTSASFRITQESVGQSLAHVRLNGPTLVMEGGFVSLNPPPVEVTNLLFNDVTTLAWDPQPAAAYEVYRGPLGFLPGTVGPCFANALPVESPMDATVPPTGGGYFYLVTARNGLLEESPKGYGSNGTLEGNPAPCP
jgi:hypothetical protein